MLLCKVFFQGSLSAEKNHPFPISRAAYKTEFIWWAFMFHFNSQLLPRKQIDRHLKFSMLAAFFLWWLFLPVLISAFLSYPLVHLFSSLFFSLYPGPLNQKMHILYCLLSRSSAVLRAVKRQEWSGLPASCCITQPVVWAAWFLAWVACSMGSKREREHTSRNSALFFLLSGWTHWQWEWFTWW